MSLYVQLFIRMIMDKAKLCGLDKGSKNNKKKDRFGDLIIRSSIVYPSRQKHASYDVPDRYDLETDQKNRQLRLRQSSKDKAK